MNLPNTEVDLRCGTNLGQIHVQSVDFLDTGVPKEQWTSIGGHSVVTPEAAGNRTAGLL